MRAAVPTGAFRILIAGVVAALLVVASSESDAQITTGTIAGTAKDQSGAVLPGVTVTAKNVATGETHVAVTNEAGRYQAAALTPGQYNVTAELAGFSTIQRSGLTVNVGSTVGLDLDMKLATVAENVTVTAEAPLVESTKTDISGVITQTAIQSLPSKQKNFLDFTLLMPATVENVSAVQGTGAVIGGAHSKEGSLLVDGFYNLDEGFTMPKQKHSQDAIQEFQVVEFGGAAEYGRAIGGVINAITKSGTNEFHGSGYGFFQNTSLNAEPFEQKFAGAPNAPYSRQQWGGSFGGPIVKNKQFFFGAVERINYNWPYNNGISAETAALIGLAPGDYGNVPRWQKSTYALGKWDYNVSNNQHFEAGFAFTKSTDQMVTYLFPLSTPSYPQQLPFVDYSYNADWRRVAEGGHGVQELKVAYFPRYYHSNGLQQGGPPLAPIGQINIGDENNASIPSVRIASVANFGSATIQNDINTYPIEAIYTSSRFVNTHTLKFGADYMYAYYDYIGLFSSLHGTYSFSSLQNYLKGIYSTYSQGFGAVDSPRAHQYIAGFVQDTWQSSKRLTVNYGLRYDLELNPHSISGDLPYGNDYNNVGPRIAMSYDLTGQGQTFLKVSSGLYYDKVWSNSTTAMDYTLKDHERRRSYTWTYGSPGAPVYPNVFASEPASLPASAHDVSLLPDEVNDPMSAQLIATLEQQLSGNVAVSVSGVYTKSWYKEYSVDQNLVWDATSGKFIRPDPNYRRITQTIYGAPAEYQALLVDLRRRSARLGFDSNLTWSRALEAPATPGGSANDPRVGIMGDYGPVPDNPTVRGVISGWYDVTGAIQVSASYVGRSGMAVDPTAAGLDLVGAGVFGTRTPTLAPFSFRAPGMNEVDTKLTYAIPLASAQRLNVSLEVFNLFNNANVMNVDNNYGPTPGQPLATFMRPLSYFAPRTVQLGVRFTF